MPTLDKIISVTVNIKCTIQPPDLEMLEREDLREARFFSHWPMVEDYVKRMGLDMDLDHNIRVLRPVVDSAAYRLEPGEEDEVQQVANVLKLAAEAGMLPMHGSNMPFGLKLLASRTLDAARGLLAGQYRGITIDTECHDIGRAGCRMFIRLRRRSYTLTLAYNVAPLANPVP